MRARWGEIKRQLILGIPALGHYRKLALELGRSALRLNSDFDAAFCVALLTQNSMSR
jgi:hypothetical protein